ncbi:MAG: hypothetical protein O3A47_08830 [Chloroflexi bacterium]|nr:hypothetical protein [Chloroflexota bacterium]
MALRGESLIFSIGPAIFTGPASVCSRSTTRRKIGATCGQSGHFAGVVEG